MRRSPFTHRRTSPPAAPEARRRRRFSPASGAVGAADPLVLENQWPDLKQRFIRMHDQVYIFNGRNRMRAFTGTGFRNEGIIPPDAASFGAPAAGAAGEPDGTYQYYVTAANTRVSVGDQRYVESLPVPLTPVTVSNQKVSLTFPAVHSDPQVTHWVLYRNKNGFYDTNLADEDQDFFKVAEIPIGTTAYTDDIHDDDLPGYPTVSFLAELAPAFKYGAIFANTFFGCGFDPFSDGTATLISSDSAAETSIIEINGLAGLGLPDGIRNCYFQKDGEYAKYPILGLYSSNRLIVSGPFVGTLNGDDYRIYQDQSLLFRSEFNDAEKWGLELELNADPVGGPGSKLALTGCFAAHGVLYIFTLDQVYRLRGTSVRDFAISQQPIIDHIGCVSSWTCVLVGGVLYWLSLKGPVAFNPDATGQEGFARVGEPLGEDWADLLNEAQLSLSEGGYDPVTHTIKWSVPLANENTNGKVLVYDLRTNSWWIEVDWGWNVGWPDYDSNSKERLVTAMGRKMFFESEGNIDGVPAGDTEATVTGYNAGTREVTCAAAAFYTTGYGLEELWAHVYRYTSGSWVRIGKSKIDSNTATKLVLRDTSDFTDDPDEDDVVYVGAITFKWRTKTFSYPEVNQRSLDFIVRFALQEDSGQESRLWYRTVQNQTNQNGMPAVTVDEVHKELPSHSAGPEVAMDLEIREPGAKVALRSVVLETLARGGQE